MTVEAEEEVCDLLVSYRYHLLTFLSGYNGGGGQHYSGGGQSYSGGGSGYENQQGGGNGGGRW